MHVIAGFYSITLAGFYSRDIVVNIFGRVCKESLESVPGPLECVFNGVGEVLEGADGYLLLWRVLGGAITLSQVGNHNLRGRERKKPIHVNHYAKINNMYIILFKGAMAQKGIHVYACRAVL